MYAGTKIKLKLVGLDGNAFSIMGAVRNAARQQGIPKEVQDEYSQRAMSGDYDNLLAVTMEYVEEPFGDDDEDEECYGCGKYLDDCTCGEED